VAWWLPTIYYPFFPYDGYWNNDIRWDWMGGRIHPSRRPNPSNGTSATYSWKNRLQTGTTVVKCRFVRVIITLYTYYYYYLYCSDGGDGGGIRARTLLSIAVWPAGSAGGSLASFFVITAITIEIEMWPSHDGSRCRGWPTDQNVKNIHKHTSHTLQTRTPRIYLNYSHRLPVIFFLHSPFPRMHAVNNNNNNVYYNYVLIIWYNTLPVHIQYPYIVWTHNKYTYCVYFDPGNPFRKNKIRFNRACPGVDYTYSSKSSNVYYMLTI